MSDYLKELNIYEHLFNESRYINIHLMVVVQTPSELSNITLEGCDMLLVKKLANMTESMVIAKQFNCSSKEQIRMLMELKPYEGIYVHRRISTSGAFVIIPNYLTQFVSDEMIQEYQGEAIRSIMENVIRKSTSIITLSNIEEEFDYNLRLTTQDFKDQPFHFLRERETRLGKNISLISESINLLVQNGWLIRHPSKIDLGKSYGQFQPYLFTKKAEKEFGYQAIRGKGGIKHQFWQYRCTKHFRSHGYKVKIEYFLDNSKSVDVVAENDMEKIAIQIEFEDNRNHILENITICIDSSEKFDKIIVAVYNAKLWKRVQSFVSTDSKIEQWLLDGRLEIRFLNEFLD
jgi:hypothetical protein